MTDFPKNMISRRACTVQKAVAGCWFWFWLTLGIQAWILFDLTYLAQARHIVVAPKVVLSSQEVLPHPPAPSFRDLDEDVHNDKRRGREQEDDGRRVRDLPEVTVEAVEAATEDKAQKARKRPQPPVSQRRLEVPTNPLRRKRSSFQRGVHRKRRHSDKRHYVYKTNPTTTTASAQHQQGNHDLLLQHERHLVTKRESEDENSFEVTEAGGSICATLRESRDDATMELFEDVGTLVSDPILLGLTSEAEDHCQLQVSLKHPLFEIVASVGLVAGIQYQVTMRTSGYCDNLTVGVSAGTGNLFGVKYANCSTASEVAMVKFEAGVTSISLAYVPNGSKSTDKISFFFHQTGENLEDDNVDGSKNKNGSGLEQPPRSKRKLSTFADRPQPLRPRFLGRKTIHLPVINECLLHIPTSTIPTPSTSSRMVSLPLSVSLGDLALAVLQTEKDWTYWHACHFVLPEVDVDMVGFRFAIRPKTASTARKECRVQVQFDGQNPACLSQDAKSSSSEAARPLSRMMFKLAIHSYDHDNSMDFLSRIGNYGLFLEKGHEGHEGQGRARRQSPPMVRVPSAGGFGKISCSDLVKFTSRPTINGNGNRNNGNKDINVATNANAYAVMNESMDKEDCVIRIHYPYGYASLLHFSLILPVEAAPTTKSMRGVRAKKSNGTHCSFVIGSELAFVNAGTTPTGSCFAFADGDSSSSEIEVASNSVEITIVKASVARMRSKLEVRGQPVVLDKLVGNCPEEDEGLDEGDGDGDLGEDANQEAADLDAIWLQMGERHCVRLDRSRPSRSWTEAEAECKTRHGGQLTVIKNNPEDNLVQNLILNSPGYKPDLGVWIGASKNSGDHDFRWPGGAKLNFTNWFPGWASEFSKEPSGGYNENCIELRQSFPGLTESGGDLDFDTKNNQTVSNPPSRNLFWNDQDCEKKNWFVCSKELPKSGFPNLMAVTRTGSNCSIRVRLSREQPNQLISSKKHYLKELPWNCTYEIGAYNGGAINVEFQKFKMAGANFGQNSDCTEAGLTVEQRIRGLRGWHHVRRYCGDWTGSLKALHVVTDSSRLRISVWRTPASPSLGLLNTNKDNSGYIKNIGAGNMGFEAKVIAIPKSWRRLSSGANVSEVRGSRGRISSSNFPKDYPPSRTHTVHILGPASTKIRLRFQNLTVEWSEGCRFDSIVISDTKNVSVDRSARLCGNYRTQDKQTLLPSVYTYESHTNEAWVVMTSDETVGFSGYLATWEALPVSTCGNRTLRGINSGFIDSPGYPSEDTARFATPMDCWTNIIAPVDHRVVLTFEMLDFLIPTVASAGFRIEACRGSSFVEIDVGGGDSLKYCLDEDEAGAQHRQSVHGAVGRPRGRREASRRLDKMKYSMVPASSNHSRPGAASDIIKNNPDSKDKEDHWLEFVSSGNRLSVRFYSSRGRLLGRGMRAKFKIESFQFTHIGTEFKMHDGRLNQKENKNGSSFFTNVNHPLEAPSNLKYRASLGAASGSNLQVIVPAKSVQSNCTGNFVQFEDPYSRPVKTWKFCRFTDEVGSAEADVDVDVVILQSFLNTLNVLQVTGAGPSGMKFSMQVKSLPDEDIIQKVLQLTRDNHLKKLQPKKSDLNKTDSANTAVSVVSMGSNGEDACDENLCLNGGWCDPLNNKCICKGHFIGKFCLQTSCEIQPCQNGGICSLTPNSYKCSCPQGFGGGHCERRLRPCETFPCKNGICIEDKTKKDGYRCQCHLWWIGPTCERRIKNIPFKPLSERMMEEPFWLGLLAVFVVLGILGLGYMLKKHLPDKFEKILSDGTDGKAKPGGGDLRVTDRSFGGAPGHHSTYGTQMSFSDHDTVFGDGHDKNDHRGRFGAAHGSNGPSFDTSPSSVAKNLLGKFNIRKASILSISSIGSSPGYKDSKDFSSLEELYPNSAGSHGKRSPSAPKKSLQVNDEETRKILKMLVTPTSTKRTLSSASFDSMVIKAARSAENLPHPDGGTIGVGPVGGGSGRSMSICNKNTDATIIRKESSSSLQIPGMLRRSNSESNKGHPNSIKEDSLDCSKKVVTFSQVVDQMACSFSDSSSLSDLSSCTEDFKHSVSTHVPRRTNRKLMRSSRINKRNRQAAVLAGGYFGQARGGSLGNGTSGSEADINCESSMESIESSNTNLTLHPLSALNKDPSKKLQKISSSDSLMSMIKSLAANRKSASTPSSPQLSEFGDVTSVSSGFPTPLTTPETPCPKTSVFCSSRSGASASTSSGGGGGKDVHVLQKHRRISGDSTSSSPSMSPTRSSSQIMVEVLDPLNPKQSGEGAKNLSAGIGSQSGGGGGSGNNNPTITLEVPNFNFGKCLSPIKELPSPIPTPIPSPLPHSRGRLGPQSAHGGSREICQISQDDVSSSSSSSSTSKSTSSVVSAKANKAVKALSARRSSFTAFCKKAAGAGKGGKNRRTSLAKISMSTSDDIMDDENSIPMRELIKKDEAGCDYNEISIDVPCLAPPPRAFAAVKKSRPPPPIPIITLTEPDSDFEFDEEDDEDFDPDEDDMEVVNAMGGNFMSAGDLPAIAVSPPSPRPGRHEMVTAFNIEETTESEEDYSSGSIIAPPPPIKVTITPSASALAKANGGCNKGRPPPLQLVNSNFDEHHDGNNVVADRLQQSVIKDAMSKPDSTPTQTGSNNPSLMVTSPRSTTTAATTKMSAASAISPPGLGGASRQIELRELRPKSPNNNFNVNVADHNSSNRSTHNNNSSNSLVRSAKLVKQPNIAEERNLLLKQTENVTEESIQVPSLPTSTMLSVSNKNQNIEDMDFLIPPGTKFDSTPRSRSQSVEIPEFQLLSALGAGAPPAERKLSLTRPTITLGGGGGHQQQSQQQQHHPPMLKVNVMVQPPTPTTAIHPSAQAAWESERDQGLVSLMQKRSQQGQMRSADIKAAADSWTGIKLGSPPAKRADLSLRPPDSSVNPSEKPRSLDIPAVGPAIMVTPMSEIESDDQVEPMVHIPTSSSTNKANNMHYLSPFTIITTTCSSRTTSESNLSSSGYSSMASPGPSRSGSSNPLCISESEDTSTPTKTTTTFFPKLSVTPPAILLGGSSGASGGGGMGPVVIRRPNNLLKSPSVDSESSDPVNANYGKAFLGHHKAPLMAARYRTDSETTDEHCIPESISEAHDSAIDSTEDIEEEDETAVTEAVEAAVVVEEEEEEEVDVSPNCDIVPQIMTTLEVQSSTESDKTVLSTTTVRDFSASNLLMTSASAASLVSSAETLTISNTTASIGKVMSKPAIKMINLTLPDIVVEPCSPDQSSASEVSSPTAVRPDPLSSSSTSSSSSLSLGLGPVFSSSSSSQTEKRLLPMKSRSVPPLALAAIQASSIEYDQLSLGTSTTSSSAPASAIPSGLMHHQSASSSRSESPMSDRFCLKCSSMVSLQGAVTRSVESDGFVSSFETRTTSTQTKPMHKKRKTSERERPKRPSSAKTKSKSSLDEAEMALKSGASSGSTSVIEVATTSEAAIGTPQRRRRLRSQTRLEAQVSSSSNESLYSAPSTCTKALFILTSSSDEAHQEAAAAMAASTGLPSSSPSSCSLKATTTTSSSSGASKQGSPMGSSMGLLHIPSTSSLKQRPPRPKRKKSSKTITASSSKNNSSNKTVVQPQSLEEPAMTLLAPPSASATE